jgi:hypothetical protein
MSEARVRALRAQLAEARDDEERDRIGRELDRLCDRLEAPPGFRTYRDFQSLDHLMRQPPR